MGPVGIYVCSLTQDAFDREVLVLKVIKKFNKGIQLKNGTDGKRYHSEAFV